LDNNILTIIKMRVEITESDRKDKKMKAIFYDGDKKIKTTHFGAKNPKIGTYIEHKDKSIKFAWIARHEVRGDFKDFMTPSSLSYHILWNKPTLQASIKDYKNKFNLD